MDPTNNPIQNLNSVPGGTTPEPGVGMGVNAGPAPVNNEMPNNGVPMSGAPAPMGGPAPMGNPAPIQQPVGGQMSPGQMFQAGGVAAPMGVLGAIPGDYSSANSPLLGATDPITMPTPPKAPDPVEQELNAPFKAAAPVPGSIGSAISMPGDPAQVPNVAFNDPAMMAPNASMMPNKKSLMSRFGMGDGKKMDKKTLIILGSIIAVIVFAIIFIVVTAL